MYTIDYWLFNVVYQEIVFNSMTLRILYLLIGCIKMISIYSYNSTGKGIN